MWIHHVVVTATSDLTTSIYNLLAANEDNQSNYEPYRKSWAGTKDEIAMGCELMIVYASGTLEDSGVRATIHAICILGVGY